MDRVVLVTMPFDRIREPSIQIGTVKAILARAGIPSVSKFFNVAFAQTLADELGEQASLERYDLVGAGGHNRLAGDWVFRLPFLFDRDVGQPDEDYLAHLSRQPHTARLVPAARALRERAPAFLDRCADEVLAHAPRVVGFTLMFGQTTASAALAKLLKARDPSLRVVFGGACCQGPMGKALFRMFPFVDVIVRGEAEQLAPYVFRRLLDGTPLEPRDGLCARDGGRELVADAEAPNSPMTEVPAPIYDEYFEALRSCAIGPSLFPDVSLVFEAARGCWFGEKSHCTFCGLNSTSLAYRSKPAGRVLDEIVALAERHRVHRFFATDTIFDLKYFDELLPRVAELGFDLDFLLETKVNLTYAQLAALRRAGATQVQGGVESLSTPILRLMKKGATALQNLRFLKWCHELEIRAHWNFLMGFPGEPIEEYARMAASIPKLVHLPPPSGSPYRIRIDRFSPYHSRPGDFGLTLTGPLPHYALVYPGVDAETLADCAFSFGFEYDRPDDPYQYTAPLADQVDAWCTAWRSGAPPTFKQYRGPGFVRLVDRRGPDEVVHTLAHADAALYLACDEGVRAAPARAAAERAGFALSEAEARARLDAMVTAGLMLEEDGRYLSLAVAARPRAAQAHQASDLGEPPAVSALLRLASPGRPPSAN